MACLSLLGEQIVRAKERIEIELKNEEPVSKDSTKSDV